MSTIVFSVGKKMQIDAGARPKVKRLLANYRERIVSITFGVEVYTDEVNTDFCKYLAKNQTLEDLHFGKRQRSLNSFVPAIVRAILSNPKTHLKRINFSGAGLGDEQAKYIAALIKGNTSLQDLNLNNGTFGETSLHLITDVILQHNFFIEEIWTFSNPNLRTADMRIFEAIARNKENNKGKRMFAHELDNNEMVRWGRSKLMVIGQGGAGKTSTVRSLLGKAFVKEHDSTIGASLTKTDTSAWKETDVKESDFNETASRAVRKMHAAVEEKRVKEREAFLANQKVKFNLDDVLLTEELTQPKSLKGGFDDAGSTSGGGGKSKAATKGALKSKKGDAEEEFEIDREPIAGENFEALVEGKLLHETDVARRFKDRLISKAIQDGDDQDDENKLTFTIWDYGGQTVFYTLHHLFLTKYGVYLIVFDLSKFLGSYDDAHAEAVQFLRFWIRSVMLHAPEAPAILVGTHLDTVLKKVKASAIPEFFKKVDESLKHDIHVTMHKPLVRNGDSLFFPLDNAKGVGVDALRKEIDDAARDKPYVQQKIPLRWVLTLDLLINEDELEDASSRTWVGLNEIEKTGERFGVGKREATEMLKLFNQLGVLIYLNATEALRDVIITDPQWLIYKLGKVIRDDMHGAPQELTEDLKDDWDRLRDRAIAGQDLLDVVWKDSEVTSQMVRQFPNEPKRDVVLRRYNEKQSKFLVDLMQNTMLMSEWVWARSKQKEAIYLIPSLVQSRKEAILELNNKLSEWPHGSDSTLFLDFSEFFLPTGIFQRIVCMLVAVIGHQKAVGMEPILGEDFAYMTFSGKANQNMNTDLFLRVHSDARIMVNIHNGSSASDMLLVMTSLVRRLREQVTGSRLKVKLLLTQRTSPFEPPPKERPSLRKTTGSGKKKTKRERGKADDKGILPTGPLLDPQNFEEAEHREAQSNKAFEGWFESRKKGVTVFRIEEFLI